MKIDINLLWLQELLVNGEYYIELYNNDVDTGIMAILQNKKVIIKDNSVIMTFDSPVWKKSSIKANKAKIKSGDMIVCNIDFGQEYESVNGDFKIKFPEALIRIS